MTISRTLYAGFTSSDGHFDAGKFVEAVLLFDTVLISNHSILPELIRSTEVSGFLRLLEEGRLAVVGGGPSAQGTYDFKSPGFFSHKPLNRPLRFGFETIYVDPKNPKNLSNEDRLARDLKKTKEIAAVNDVQLNEIHASILPTMRVIDGSTLKTSDDFRADIESKQEFLVEIFIDSLEKELPIHTSNVQISIEEVHDETFQINTNIGKILNINDERLHELFKKPFFEITGTNLQLHRMRAVEAAAGLTEVQTDITARRLDFLSKLHTQSDIRPTFARVIEIARVPFLEPRSVIDVAELIELRESSEACAFRDWLQHSQKLQDNEIEELLTGWRNKLGETLKTRNAKALRWLSSTGAGTLNPITGILFSTVDFILDKFLPGMGPIGFIVGDYKKYIQSHSNV
jgi:hypothetical protein